jgi:sterol desaturase/sphingolipid hydroxylase (fatty acid hydroxylase superfamily)
MATDNPMTLNLLTTFILCFIFFVPLERFFSLRKEQQIFRRGWWVDTLHFFINDCWVEISTLLIVLPLAAKVRSQLPEAYKIAVLSQSPSLQFIEGLLIGEFFHYWAHRLAHRVPRLWRFHAIHHGAKEMDWLVTVRLHPFDRVFIKCATIIPLYVLGFSKQTFGMFLVFVGLHALFIHSNVKFQLRWARFIISTPQIHHWHHAVEREAHDRNFGGILSIYDLIFGTFYAPKNLMPSEYGIPESIPEGYIGQMIFPIRRRQASPAD